jgi:tetratricopeptide (TPR) repeat protein
MIRLLRSLLKRLHDAEALDASESSCCQPATKESANPADWFDPDLPLSVRVLIFRGAIRLNEKRLDEAMEHINAAIDLEPSNPSALFYRGVIHSRKGQHEDAVIDLTRSVALNPKNSSAFRELGHSRRQLRDYRNAAMEFTKAARLDPNDAFSFVSRASCWFHLGENIEGLEDLEEVLRLTDDMEEIAPAETTEVTDERLLEAEPHLRNDRVDAFLMRGVVLAQSDDFEKALTVCHDAIEQDPDDFWSAQNAAWILATCPEPRMRDGQNAVSTALKACEKSNWEEARCIESLAAAYAESGDFANAIRWQTRFQEMCEVDDQERCEHCLEKYSRSQPCHEMLFDLVPRTESIEKV